MQPMISYSKLPEKFILSPIFKESLLNHKHYNAILQSKNKNFFIFVSNKFKMEI